MEKNYNIGLDIGTNSVGWAITDKDGNLIKRNGRYLWGSRLFEKANTASERRSFRSNTRRLTRRKERIKLLQELLKEDVCASYPDFYNDLKLSKYYNGDGIKNKEIDITRKNKYNLFSDDTFSDKDYYKDYKTIYHLRDKLCKTTKKMDIRLVYLALHHIIKYRGNFIYEGTNFKVTNTSEMQDKLKELLDDFVCEIAYTEDDLEVTFEVLRNNKKSKKEKLENILSLYNVKDPKIKKKLKGIFNYIIGMKEKLSTVFDIDIEKDKSIRLTDEYDETEIEEILGENYYYFEIIKELNSWYTLQYILKNKDSISEAFIQKYDKYKKDLKALKKLYIKIPEKYNEMFKTNENYTSYDKKKLSIEELYKKIERDLKNFPDSKEKEEILKDIKKEEFLVRINSRENGAIPYQLHKKELEKIIDNQSKYYPSLKENKEKIIQILTFKIPYYVGPLNSKDNPSRNWSIRFKGKEHEKVYPWNFDKIIDKDASANEFIRRMTNKCTYLPEEDVIPKNSLLYSKFCLLNELNNVRYDGKKLSFEEKELVIEKLFKVNKKVSKTKFKKFLEKENQITIDEITGLQKENEFASSLTSYIDFANIMPEGITDKNYDMIEKIIEWITVFEDKEILQSKLKSLKDENNNEILNQEQQNKIIKKNYSGWSRLSKKLLTGLIYQNEFGTKMNIMEILRKTNDNFMQIINDKTLGFDKQIESHKKQIKTTSINYKFYEENIATLAGSPAIKRGIWQAIKVVDELVHVLKAKPQNIFIEFAREDGVKERTNSRKDKLEKAYKNFKEKYKDQIDSELITSLKNKKDITERLYLYYMQNGKCMYTGETLEIDELEQCQIDHIIPQSKIKDDSFDNKVLVKLEENQKKLDGFISNKVINQQKENWRMLYEVGLISPKKYFNLLNNSETDKRIEGFIKRQLVETRQIIKNVTNILQNIYEDTNVYAIKATLGHDFRERFDILKIRELNDYHHAHDAYITSLIGEHIISRYPKMLKEFEYKDYIKEFSKKTQKSESKDPKNKYGFIINSFGKSYTQSDGKVIDENTAEERLNNILKTFDIKDMYVTKKLEEKTGAFYKQNPQPKSKIKSGTKVPRLKEGLDPLKYGSYTGEIGSYYVLISYMKKDKKEYNIVSVPVKESLKIKDKEDLKNYIKNKLNIENVNILKSKILTNHLLYKAGKPYYFVSDNEIKIAKELRLDKNEQILLYVALSDGNIKFKLYNLAEAILKNDTESKVECIDKNRIRKIKEESLNKVYDILSKKIKEEYFENIGLKLEEYKENYLSLTTDKKQTTIKLLLRLTSGSAVNLSIIGGKSDQGRINGQNMNEKWLKDVKFIEQSITGIYEKRYTKNELENSNNI